MFYYILFFISLSLPAMETEESSKVSPLKVPALRSFLQSKRDLPPDGTLLTECSEMQHAYLPLKRENLKHEYEIAQKLGDQQRVKKIEDFTRENAFQLVRPSWISFARNGFFMNKNLETELKENIANYIPVDQHKNLIDNACVRSETMQLGICYGYSAIIVTGCIILSVLMEGVLR